MINQSTIESLKAMKLTAMAAELERQMEDPSTYGKLGFEDRLGLLVDAEWNRRQANKLARYIKNAHFAAPNATIEGIEYHEDRKLDKAQILRFATCQYIQEGHHIILKGASGNGKTYLACALGHAACRKFKSVKYIRMPELLDELSIAKGCGTFKKTIKSYKTVDLLILDDFGVQDDSKEWIIECFYGLINYRYGNIGSTIITSNVPRGYDGTEDRIKSRFEEMCVEIHLPEYSVRSAKAKADEKRFLAELLAEGDPT